MSDGVGRGQLALIVVLHIFMARQVDGHLDASIPLELEIQLHCTPFSCFEVQAAVYDWDSPQDFDQAVDAPQQALEYRRHKSIKSMT